MLFWLIPQFVQEHTKNSIISFKGKWLAATALQIFLLLSPTKWATSGLWENNKCKVMKILDPGNVVMSHLATINLGSHSGWPTSPVSGVNEGARLRTPSLFPGWWPWAAWLCSLAAGQSLQRQGLATFTLTCQLPENICWEPPGQGSSALWQLLFREENEHRFWSQQEWESVAFCGLLFGK